MSSDAVGQGAAPTSSGECPKAKAGLAPKVVRSCVAQGQTESLLALPLSTELTLLELRDTREEQQCNGNRSNVNNDPL